MIIEVKLKQWIKGKLIKMEMLHINDELFTQQQRYKNPYDTRYKNNSCINIKNNHIEDKKLEMKKS